MSQARPTPRAGAPAVVLASVLAWAAALAVVAWCVAGALAARGSGRDFAPLYAAAVAVRWHEPVYAVAGFVYPPVAAYAAVPLTLLPQRAAVVLFTVVAAAAMVAACLLTTTSLTPRSQRRWAPALAGAAVAVLFAAHPTLRSLRLANASVLLPLVLVVACRSWAHGRWGTGTAVLAASLLVKPVLLPLVLVPLARGRLRPLLLWGAASAAVLVVSILAGAGTSGLAGAVHSLLGAQYFLGREAPQNLSLAGLGRAHHLSGALVLPLRAVAVLVGAATLLRWAAADRTAEGSEAAEDAERDRVGALLAVSTAVMAALLLAGSISEVHYLLVLLPGVAALARCRRRVPALAAVAAVVAFLAAARSGYHTSTQLLLVASQALALLSSAALLLRRPRPPGDRAAGAGPGSRPHRGASRPACSSSQAASRR